MYLYIPAVGRYLKLSLPETDGKSKYLSNLLPKILVDIWFCTMGELLNGFHLFSERTRLRRHRIRHHPFIGQ